MTDQNLSKEEVERRATEAARRLLTTPKPGKTGEKDREPNEIRSKPPVKGSNSVKAHA